MSVSESSPVQRAAVVGAGQMGNGIAHVFATSGHAVTMIDVSADALTRGRDTIAKNLDRQVKKGALEAAAAEAALGRISTATSLDAVAWGTWNAALYRATTWSPRFFAWARSVQLIHAHMGYTGVHGLYAARKLEKPLVTLAGTNGGALIISTIADVTFFGKDQTGRDVTVTGSMSINFADWADQ